MSMIGVDPNSFTKDRLKLELRNNGVTMPSPDSRKEVYVKLYRAHVLDKKQTEFSSDDESISNTPKRKKKPAPKGKVIKDSMPTFTDVTSLSDADLATKLRELGVDVGPILDSTRKVYQRKLERLLSESVKAEPIPAKSPSPKKSPSRAARSRPIPKPREEPEEEEFSDQDETDSMAVTKQTEAEEELQRRLENLRRRPLAKDSPTSIRPARIIPEISKPRPQPPVMQAEEEEEEPEIYEKEEETNHVTPQKDHTNSTQNHTVVSPAKPTRRISIWIQVAVLVVVAIIIFLVIQNLEPAKKSTFGSIDSV